MKAMRKTIRLGTHGEQYGNWMPVSMLSLMGGLLALAAALAVLCFAAFHWNVLGVLFTLAALALAVAQTESNFDMDAVGSSGEVGIMQLNPGPGGSYHAEIQEATGLDPTTASGNIAGGCYKLGTYLAKYENVEKAAMAYNMGEAGAKAAWKNGITSTDYSRAVKEAMETWECTVNAWGGV